MRELSSRRPSPPFATTAIGFKCWATWKEVSPTSSPEENHTLQWAGSVLSWTPPLPSCRPPPPPCSPHSSSPSFHSPCCCLQSPSRLSTKIQTRAEDPFQLEDQVCLVARGCAIMVKTRAQTFSWDLNRNHFLKGEPSPPSVLNELGQFSLLECAFLFTQRG